jgi:membrane protein DedA with SNARE-associated domain
MISALVASYGYFAVFFGTLIEGETILLAAGFAAHRGLLDWRIVVALAFAGGCLGDLLAFLLGRWQGEAIMARFPSIARRAPRVLALLERHHVGLILGVRFIYGLRVAGPVVIGASGVSLARFAVLNMIGSALWASAVGGAGYYFGAALAAVLVDLKRFEQTVLIGMLGAGALFWLWRWRGNAARRRADGSAR